jgi:hexosaminidase
MIISFINILSLIIKNIMRKAFLFSLCVSTSIICLSQQLSIIPQPVSAKKLAGDFKLSIATTIVLRDEEDKKAALFFNEYLNEVYGFMLPVSKDERKDFIRLTTKKNDKTPGKDGYTLLVSKGGITIDGDTYAGTFYGVQSLIQLLEPYDFKSIISKKNGISVSSLFVPSVSVQDYPGSATVECTWTWAGTFTP